MIKSSFLSTQVQILKRQDVGIVRDRLKFQDSDLPLTLREGWSEENLKNADEEENVYDRDLEARIQNKFEYYANFSSLIKSPSPLE